MINIIYAALPTHALTEKMTFLCKDGCTLTKYTHCWTYSARDFEIPLCHTPPLRSFFVKIVDPKLTPFCQNNYQNYLMLKCDCPNQDIRNFTKVFHTSKVTADIADLTNVSINIIQHFSFLNILRNLCPSVLFCTKRGLKHHHYHHYHNQQTFRCSMT